MSPQMFIEEIDGSNAVENINFVGSCRYTVCVGVSRCNQCMAQTVSKWKFSVDNGYVVQIVDNQEPLSIPTEPFQHLFNDFLSIGIGHANCTFGFASDLLKPGRDRPRIDPTDPEYRIIIMLLRISISEGSDCLADTTQTV